MKAAKERMSRDVINGRGVKCSVCFHIVCPVAMATFFRSNQDVHTVGGELIRYSDILGTTSSPWKIVNGVSRDDSAPHSGQMCWGFFSPERAAWKSIPVHFSHVCSWCMSLSSERPCRHPAQKKCTQLVRPVTATGSGSSRPPAVIGLRQEITLPSWSSLSPAST